MKKNKYLYAVVGEDKQFTTISAIKEIKNKVHIIRPLSIFDLLENAEEALSLSKKRYKTMSKEEKFWRINPNKAKIIKIKY